MKKKDINGIIERLTELETTIARDIYSKTHVQEQVCLKWFDVLYNITNDLDKIYKGKNEKRKETLQS